MTHLNYMLDTNIASYIIKGSHPVVLKHLRQIPMSRICISSITEAELRFGLAKRGEPQPLKILVHEFLRRVAILPWDSKAAEKYASLRKTLEQQGKTLGAMDMLIAAHASALGVTLITHDQAFQHAVLFLKQDDWTKE